MMKRSSTVGASNLALVGGVCLALVVAWIAFRVLFGTLVLALKLGFALVLVVVIAFAVIGLRRGRAAGR